MPRLRSEDLRWSRSAKLALRTPPKCESVKYPRSFTSHRCSLTIARGRRSRYRTVAMPDVRSASSPLCEGAAGVFLLRASSKRFAGWSSKATKKSSCPASIWEVTERDLGRRIDFLGLLERILSETSIPRIRISSIEPMDVGPQLIRLVASDDRLAQHFHVPLQSGCDRILRQMNRRYWAAQYAERVLAIGEQIPDSASAPTSW